MTFESAIPEQMWEGAWQALRPFQLNQIALTIDVREAFCKLAARYAEPHRYYHNLNHVTRILAAKNLADAFGDDRRREGCFKLAVWFHDVIYDLKSKTNELDSWIFAQEVLIEAHPKVVSAREMEMIRGLIMATKHDAVLTDPYEQLIADLDLSGFASREVRAHTLAIEAEYLTCYTAEEFKAGRIKFLEGMLQRSHARGIFYSGNPDHEEAARWAIQLELADRKRP